MENIDEQSSEMGELLSWEVFLRAIPPTRCEALLRVWSLPPILLSLILDISNRDLTGFCEAREVPKDMLTVLSLLESSLKLVGKLEVSALVLLGLL